jgi:hypothetical protein
MICFPKKVEESGKQAKARTTPPADYYYDRKTKEDHVPSCVFLFQLTAIMLTITPQHFVLVSLILPNSTGFSSSLLVTTTTARPRSSQVPSTQSFTLSRTQLWDVTTLDG